MDVGAWSEDVAGIDACCKRQCPFLAGRIAVELAHALLVVVLGVHLVAWNVFRKLSVVVVGTGALVLKRYFTSRLKREIMLMLS